MGQSKTARIEFRTGLRDEGRIRDAARLSRVSVSSFVRDAVSARADEVLANSASTVLPAEFFDAVWASLGEAPEANAHLARAATHVRAPQR